MSGGSYDYLYQKMEDGDVSAFLRWVDELIEQYRELDRRLVAGEIETWEQSPGAPKGHTRRCQLQPEDVAAGGVAIPAVIAALMSAKAQAVLLGDTLRSLAALAHAAEWQKSGDTGADNTLFDAIDWMRARLGLPKKERP